MTQAKVTQLAGYQPVYGEAGFNNYVGPVWRANDGTHYVFDVRAEHLNGGGTLHGGMAMALAEMMMGRAVRDVTGDQLVATVSLNCDLIGPATLGERVTGKVTITRRTRTIVFASSDLGAGGRQVVTATGIWKILSAD